ncbi:MAG: hypothetical protein AB7V42_07675 [Thermoleophilia bacterium]
MRTRPVRAWTAALLGLVVALIGGSGVANAEPTPSQPARVTCVTCVPLTDQIQAHVWDASLDPVSGVGVRTARDGGGSPARIYLPASRANGLVLTVTAGTATARAVSATGMVVRDVATLTPGASHTVSGLAAGEALFVASPAAAGFTMAADPADPPGPDCTNPLTCDPVDSILTSWKCNIPACTGDDWGGQVIAWPSWAAYSDNARTGDNSRTTFEMDTGEKLYPYAGPWIDGCKITATYEHILIIEWKRGTDVWRPTYLAPGQSHVISLQGDEDNVLIESPDNWVQFGAKIENCTPQPI